MTAIRGVSTRVVSTRAVSTRVAVRSRWASALGVARSRSSRRDGRRRRLPHELHVEHEDRDRDDRNVEPKDHDRGEVEVVEVSEDLHGLRARGRRLHERRGHECLDDLARESGRGPCRHLRGC